MSKSGYVKVIFYKDELELAPLVDDEVNVNVVLLKL